MAQGSRSNQTVVRQATAALEEMKWEVARELGVHVPEDRYMGGISARENGAIGGHMVRKMIEQAEQQLAGRESMTSRPSR